MAKVLRSIQVVFVISLLLIGTTSGASAGVHVHSRKMLQSWSSRSTGSQTAIQTLRSQAATSQAIEQAVLSGGSLPATARAGAVGSSMTWAAAQNNRNVFSVVERSWGPPFWGHK